MKFKGNIQPLQKLNLVDFNDSNWLSRSVWTSYLIMHVKPRICRVHSSKGDFFFRTTLTIGKFTVISKAITYLHLFFLIVALFPNLWSFCLQSFKEPHDIIHTPFPNLLESNRRLSFLSLSFGYCLLDSTVKKTKQKKNVCIWFVHKTNKLSLTISVKLDT